MVTVVKLTASSESNEALKKYVNDNAQLIQGPKDEFHTTVLYTEEVPVFPREEVRRIEGEGLPLEVNPITYRFDVFGEGNLVLRYEDEGVTAIRSAVISEAIRQIICEWCDLRDEERKILERSMPRRKSTVYWDFSPHISIGKKFDPRLLNRLQPFTEPLVLESLVIENK